MKHPRRRLAALALAAAILSAFGIAPAQAHCLVTRCRAAPGSFPPQQLWMKSSGLASYQPLQRAGFHQAFARSSNPPCALPHHAVMDTLAEGRRQAMGSAFLSRCILNSFPDNTHFP